MMKGLVIVCALVMLGGCGKSETRKTAARTVTPNVEVACQGFYGSATVTVTVNGKTTAAPQDKKLRWVECEAVSLKGPSAKTCWMLKIECKNGLAIKSKQCLTVSKGQTRKTKISAKELTGGKVCAGEKSISVNPLTTTPL